MKSFGKEEEKKIRQIAGNLNRSVLFLSITTKPNGHWWIVRVCFFFSCKLVHVSSDHLTHVLCLHLFFSFFCLIFYFLLWFVKSFKWDVQNDKLGNANFVHLHAYRSTNRNPLDLQNGFMEIYTNLCYVNFWSVSLFWLHSAKVNFFSFIRQRILKITPLCVWQQD